MSKWEFFRAVPHDNSRGCCPKKIAEGDAARAPEEREASDKKKTGRIVRNFL